MRILKIQSGFKTRLDMKYEPAQNPRGKQLKKKVDISVGDSIRWLLANFELP